MPKLSIFTPVGLLRCSANPSEARTIYDVKVRALGGSSYASTAPGSRLHAKLYAQSIRQAVIRMLLRRAAETDDPQRIVPEMVPLREYEYGVTPVAGTSMHARKATLQLAYRLPRGGHRYEVNAALQQVLGAGFIYYRVFKPSTDTRVLYPPEIGDSPMNLRSPGVPRMIIRLDPTVGVSFPSITPQTVKYTPFLPQPQGGVPVLLGGETLIVEPEISARAERVLVLGVGVDGVTGSPTILGAFQKAHEPNATATTQPFPLWVTNQRYALIVVTPAVVADPNLIRQIHIVMRRLARAVSTWAIVEESSVTPYGQPGTTGPFKINISPLGSTPLGTIAFP